MGSDTRKMAMMIDLLERGVPEDQVGAPVLALMPLDDRVQPSRAYEKAARKLLDEPHYSQRYDVALGLASAEESA